MAYEAYVTIEGTKQGQFKPSSPKAKRSDKWIDIISFSMGASVAIDANGWKPKGNRVHDPVTITMEACAASPQLLQALYTSEVLKQVVLEFVNRVEDGSKEQVTERITIKDAVIANIRRYTSVSAKEKVEHDVENLEDISFRFRQITVENLIGSTSVTDDYATPG